LRAIDRFVELGDVVDVDEFAPELGREERAKESERGANPEGRVNDVQALEVLLVLAIEDLVALAEKGEGGAILAGEARVDVDENVVLLDNRIQDGNGEQQHHFEVDRFGGQRRGDNNDNRQSIARRHMLMIFDRDAFELC
jgi:hypothetical protein